MHMQLHWYNYNVRYADINLWCN